MGAPATTAVHAPLVKPAKHLGGMGVLESLMTVQASLTSWYDLRVLFERPVPKQTDTIDGVPAQIANATSFINSLRESIQLRNLSVPNTMLVSAWSRWATAVASIGQWDSWGDVLCPSDAAVWHGLPTSALHAAIQVHVKDTLIKLFRAENDLPALKCAMAALRPHIGTVFADPIGDDVPTLQEMRDVCDVVFISETPTEDLPAVQDLLVRIANPKDAVQSVFMKAGPPLSILVRPLRCLLCDTSSVRVCQIVHRTTRAR